MKNNRIINHWLLPLSWLYAGVVKLRNKLFDWGYLRSKSFPVPILCIGNLAVGGTGKTPHTEYLIRLLSDSGFRVATLSRGYKRRTQGFLLSSPERTAEELGDEPFQMSRKFPEVTVAVDANRCRGIAQLLQLSPTPEVILLDDAFQHRYVKAGLYILLTEYNRLWCDDAVLPAGRLREPCQGKDRAQIVIVTKCPDHLKPIDYKMVSKQLQLYPYQQIYFSRLRYGALTPLFPNSIQKGEEPLHTEEPPMPAKREEEMKTKGRNKQHVEGEILLHQRAEGEKTGEKNNQHEVGEAVLRKRGMGTRERNNLYVEEGPILPEGKERKQTLPEGADAVLLLSGIAHPEPFIAEVSRYGVPVEVITFADHHAFSARDMAQIRERFRQLKASHPILITTEKDGARLLHHPDLDEHLKPYIYLLPIEIEILQEKQESFNQNIIHYVRTYSTDCSLY